MNLDNRELLEMREKVFEEYRACGSRIRDLDSSVREMYGQIEQIRDQAQFYHKQQAELKSLIEIMIEHDCDPVLAKLKYAELVKQHEVEDTMPAMKSLGSTDYAYGYNFKAAQSNSINKVYRT